MRVSERMSAPAITISPELSHHSALQLMQDHGMHHLPVVGAGDQLLGIVAERDLLLAVAHYLQTPVEVAEVMKRDVVTVTPTMSLTEAAALMVRHKIGGLPVLGPDGRVVGVITETDIFATFVALAEAGQPFSLARGA